jgi:putative FmdB family regulatory protein
VPLYTYKCANCKHEEEKLESIHAPLIQDCPHCNAPKTLERQIVGAPSVVFSGGGWYAQGYTK